MRRFIIFIFALGLGLGWQVRQATHAYSQGRRGGVPGVGLAPAPQAGHGRHYDRRGPVYIYPYSYPGYSLYNPRLVVVSPYASYYIPPTVVVTSPYFCLLHQNGWVTRAGFLDHLAGTHRLPLESAASFCPDGVDSCLFPGY